MEIEKYKSYTLEDFLEDQDFRHWILKPNSESNLHWMTVFKQYPDQEKVAKDARVLLLEMNNYFNTQDLKNKALDKAFMDGLRERMKTQKKQKSKVFTLYLPVAASIILLAGLFTWFMLTQNLQTISTTYGQWKSFTLPDGSKVKLNANSEIKYYDDWQTGKDRKVWLTGEAFFEVEKDPKKARFTVFTEDMAVEVLGTKFNVQSSGEKTVVFLQEGKVRLDMGKEEQILKPGEFLAYSSKKKAITAYKKTSAELHTSWKDGSLIFRNKSVSAIFQRIEEIYGYEIIVENKELLKEQKTIALPMDKIEMAISILEKVLEAEIHLEGNQLLVK